ncbi:MAG: sialate O-acetylesterase, partial [Myxococcota bacterium]
MLSALVLVACRHPEPGPVPADLPPVHGAPETEPLALRHLEVAAAGQSNLEGYRNGLPGFPVPPGSRWFDHGEPRDAFGAGAGVNGVHHGPEAAFLQELAAHGVTSSLVKHGEPGSAIAQWLDTEADALIAEAAVARVAPEVLIWMQGEADAGSPATVRAYPERLEAVTDRFREAWGEELLIVVIGTRVDPADPRWSAEILADQQAWVEADGRSVLVDIADAGVQPDFHLTGTSPGCDPVSYT